MHPSQINVLSTEPRVLLAYGHGIETNLLDLLAIFVTNPEIAEALSAKTQHFITTLRTCFDEVSLLVAEASTLQQAKKSANQEDSIFSIIRANLREILNLIEPLYERLPKLKNHIQIVECLISNGLRTEEDRSRICLELRLAYEELLNCLILHFNCPLTEGMPIGDRVLFLKPHLTPPVRMNPFFDLKEYSSIGLHKPIGGGEGVTLRHVEKILVAFRSVVEETRNCLRSAPTASPTITTLTSSAPANPAPYTTPPTAASAPSGKGGRVQTPSRYKTVLCRNWAKYGTCPHGSRCMFAHGEEELRS